MNDKFQELATKAAELVGQQYEVDDRYPRGREVRDKFAELIVREVLSICDKHWVWDGRMIGEHVRQHFNLEHEPPV